jgi:hypothetical protein
MPSIATCVEVNFPFGIQLSGAAVTPSVANDPLRLLLADLNGVLAGFAPILKIVDFVKTLTDAINAIPSCITQLSPSPLTSKLEEVAKKLSGLLSILPPASVPFMIRDSMSLIVLFLGGQRGMLLSLRGSITIAASLSVTADDLAAAGNLDAANELRAIVNASVQDSVSATAQLAAQSCPYNHIAKTIATVAALVKLPAPPQIPDFSAGGGTISTPQDMLNALDTAIDAMSAGIEAVGLVQKVVGVAAFGGAAADFQLG